MPRILLKMDQNEGCERNLTRQFALQPKSFIGKAFLAISLSSTNPDLEADTERRRLEHGRESTGQRAKRALTIHHVLADIS